MDKKTFFNQMAATWDQHFYTPGLKQHLEALVPLFHLHPGSKVLDVGAGTGGIIPFLLQAIGPEGLIWSVDFADKMVEIGAKKFEDEPRVRFYLVAVEALPFPDELFHHIVCFGALPHFADKHLALKEMHRVLQGDGTLIIAHALSSQEIKRHHIGAGPVSHDFLPEETEMRSLLESTGFCVLQLIDRPKCYLCEARKKSQKTLKISPQKIA
jgi:ubiquinone/menaquinone biosynthesis C-methylase UbiE